MSHLTQKPKNFFVLLTLVAKWESLLSAGIFEDYQKFLWKSLKQNTVPVPFPKLQASSRNIPQNSPREYLVPVPVIPRGLLKSCPLPRPRPRGAGNKGDFARVIPRLATLV